MTGPALALGLLGILSFSTTIIRNLSPLNLLYGIFYWFISILIMYLAGRILRGKASFTSVFRVIGFAQGIYLLSLFSLIPSIATFVRFIVSLIVFIGIWTGVSIAHGLKGWRSFILPIVYIISGVMGLLIFYTVKNGFSLAVETMEIDFGLIPPP